jgi:hypothetical protein
VPEALWTYSEFGNGRKYSDNQAEHMIGEEDVVRGFDAWTDTFADFVHRNGKVPPGQFRAFGRSAPSHRMADLRLKWRELRMGLGVAVSDSSPARQQELGVNRDATFGTSDRARAHAERKRIPDSRLPGRAWIASDDRDGVRTPTAIDASQPARRNGGRVRGHEGPVRQHAAQPSRATPPARRRHDGQVGIVKTPDSPQAADEIDVFHQWELPESADLFEHLTSDEQPVIAVWQVEHVVEDAERKDRREPHHADRARLARDIGSAVTRSVSIGSG